MADKPNANDWKQINPNLKYSESLKLYFYKGRVYDELSASHNGLIGMGCLLREMAKESNGKAGIL